MDGLKKFKGAPGYGAVLLATSLLLVACSMQASPVRSPAPAPRLQRALVLGAGGTTGRGWELGMLKGLYDAGIDLTQADLFVGTSAGSALNAQLLSGTKTIDELYDQYLRTYGFYADTATGRSPLPPPSQYVLDTFRMWQQPYTPEVGVQVGQRALNAPNVISEGVHLAAWAAS